MEFRLVFLSCYKNPHALKAAKLFNVPRTTLETLSKDNLLTPEQAASKKLGRHTVLGDALEKMLVKYLLFMETTYFGLTIADLRRLAYQLATKNNLTHPFKTEEAGRAWADLFLHRHKAVLSLRKPTGTYSRFTSVADIRRSLQSCEKFGGN